MLHETTMTSPIGPLRLIASDRGLRAVLWPGDDPERAGISGPVETDPDDPILKQAELQLSEYFAGSRKTFELPLDPMGTEFQSACWEALRGIPYGKTITYGEQANRIGRPSAARAVGGANGRNPISIIVPCHRVIGTGGNLTGFAGGIDTKQWLLAHERSHSV